jgi:hypothetical protein
MRFRLTAERAITGAALVMVLLLLFLFPFSHPHTDDFSYNQFLQDRGYWNASVYVFTHNGGRFLATALLFLSPLSKHQIGAYPLLTATLFTAFIGSIFLFSLVSGGKKNAVIFASFLLLCYLSFLPNLHELIYWLAGAATYLSAATLFLTLSSLHLLLVQPKYEHQKLLWLLAALNTICICGCSEAGLLLAVIPTFLHIFWLRLQKLSARKAAIPGVCWLTAALFVLLAPGSMHRHSETPFSGNLLLAIAGGAYATVIWLLQWALPLLGTSIAYAAYIAPRLRNRSQPLSAHLSARKVLLAGLLFFAVCQLIAVWMSGSMPEPRFENILFLFVLLCDLLAVQLWVNQRAEASPTYRKKALIPLALAFLIMPQHFSQAFNDLFSGAAVQFDQQNKERYAFLTQSGDSIVKVPAIAAHPDLLYTPAAACDSVPDKKDVPRLAMAEYFGKKWIYEYPCRPEKQESFIKVWLKQKRKDWFSDNQP